MLYTKKNETFVRGKNDKIYFKHFNKGNESWFKI